MFPTIDSTMVSVSSCKLCPYHPQKYERLPNASPEPSQGYLSVLNKGLSEARQKIQDAALQFRYTVDLETTYLCDVPNSSESEDSDSSTDD